MRLRTGIPLEHRIVLAELDDCGQTSLIAFPDSSTPLPLDLERDQVGRYTAQNVATLRTPYSVTVGTLARQAQAVSLLDEVLRRTRSKCGKEDLRLFDCAALDLRIRNLLAVIVRYNGHNQCSIASPISVAVRYVASSPESWTNIK